MKIIIDLHEQQLSSVVSDGVFYAQTETAIDLTTQSGEEGAFNGVSCALLAPDGVTLAHAIASEKKAILNTNTEECVKFIEGSSIDSEKIAFLAIGDSDKPLAVLPVAIKRNPLADIAPPAELAPTYPTSESLLAILSQMTAQAQRAEDAVEATEKAQKAVAQYVDVIFPTKVEQAKKTLENTTTSGVNSVTQRANQAVDVLNQKQTAIVANIDAKAQEASAALDGKVSQAEQSRKDAETAKADAVKAQGQASESASQASTSASNASKSATNAKTSETNAKTTADGLSAGLATLNGLDGRVTAIETGKGMWKHPRTGELFSFDPFPTGDGSIRVLNDASFAPCRQVAPINYTPSTGVYTYSVAEHDGYYIFWNPYDYWSKPKRVAVYDANLNCVLRLGDLATTHDGPLINGIIGGRSSALCCCVVGDAPSAGQEDTRAFISVDANTIRFALFPFSRGDQKPIKTLKFSDLGGGTFWAMWKNNGHLCALFLVSTTVDGVTRYSYVIRLLDYNLNPILNEDGTQKVVYLAKDIPSYTLEGLSLSGNNNNARQAFIWYAYGRAYIYISRNLADGGYLWRATDDDNLEPVRESIPEVDADGYCVYETDADGNVLLDTKTRAPLVKAKGVQDKPIVFQALLSGRTSNGDKCFAQAPIFSYSQGDLGCFFRYLFTNLIDTYTIDSNGNVWECCRVNLPNTAKNASTAKILYRSPRILSAGQYVKSDTKAYIAIAPLGNTVAGYGTAYNFGGFYYDSAKELVTQSGANCIVWRFMRTRDGGRIVFSNYNFRLNVAVPTTAGFASNNGLAFAQNMDAGFAFFSPLGLTLGINNLSL